MIYDLGFGIYDFYAAQAFPGSCFLSEQIVGQGKQNYEHVDGQHHYSKDPEQR